MHELIFSAERFDVLLKGKKARVRVVVKNRSAAACALTAALCLVPYRVSADSDAPALPVCRPQQEWRTPVPVWAAGLTKDGTLHSAPPEQANSVIYIDLGLHSDAPACQDPPPNGPFEFDVPKGTPGAPNGVRVKITDDDFRQDSFHDCIFDGFYTTAPGAAASAGIHEMILRPLDKSDIIMSGRYCRASASMTASLSHHPLPASPAPPRQKARAVLPDRRKTGEDRVEIPVWGARQRPDSRLRFPPPQRYGQLVFMTIVSPENCHGDDKHQDLDFPDSKADATQGGTSLFLTGNSRSQNGHCVWSGLFMYEAGSYQMGWAFLTYNAVDEAKVASTGQFCLRQPHVPLNREAAQK